MIAKNVTFGVGTIGNTEALLLCLSSVLNGKMVPEKIVLRTEGQFPSFANFYLEQLTEIARIRGAEFHIVVIKSKGARKGCDWLLDNCTTDYLWMGDDDVVFEHEALSEMLETKKRIERKVKGSWGFIVGNKRDVNNRRGYGDFSQKELDTNYLKDYDSTNLFYSYRKNGFDPACGALDTGHVFLNMLSLKYSGIRFTAFPNEFNSGGYDSLFGIRCVKADLLGFFSHQSKSWHLEKANQNFASEFPQRKNMLLRAAESLRIDDGVTEHRPFGWVGKEK
jgi:hypothetical protein